MFATNSFYKKYRAKIFQFATVLAIFGLVAMSLPAPVTATNYLHTSGNKILDASNTVVGLSGVNWFGFETDIYAPHGLWTRNWQEYLDQIKALGYNVIRLPFSNAMLDPGRMPSGIDYQKNPDLMNLTALEVMDRIVTGAGARGIRVILDNHRSTAGGGPESNGLWYTSNYPESRWISDWKMLANRYKGNDTVIGMDLRNEPFNACWGCNDLSKDWRLAAKKAGNAILSVNSNLLIIVEGVASYKGQYTWWGGNLMGVKDFPITLQVSNRLVYSPHEYPASVYPQTWFSDPTYPDNLPAVWDKYWGYLASNYPILIGEFGSRLETDSDRKWFQAFQSYIQTKRLNWTYWSLNPDSGDTGGLLLDDWLTVHQEKQNFLQPIQYPLIGSGGQNVTPTAVQSPSPTISASATPSTINTPSACQKTSLLPINDFETNNIQNWSTFKSSNSSVSITLVSPGQVGNYALKMNYSVGSGGWAGVGRTFPAPQDWSPYRAINFGFYGTNSGATIRLEILDNCAVTMSGDTAERFEYKFVDNFSGWKTFSLPWSAFVRRSDWQPLGAPNDGFTLTAIWGFSFSPISGQGSFQLDEIKLVLP